ncbi:hypothetical protein CCHR01_07225 [Colletotrichum chrysophilum]|uniref:Uncharacterized protein n=1 Tax=Colletotrichum chrysophilum TaxID=1836956 RepID=A0AAD9AMB5_9PEZI|nr:hypothetical protein CCHR01_07225 [Colletotrichum chrysophilum]
MVEGRIVERFVEKVVEVGALASLLIAPPQATSHKGALAVGTLLHIAAKYYYQARMDVPLDEFTGQKSLATATGSLPTRFTKRCRWLPTAELWRSLELEERNGLDWGPKRCLSPSDAIEETAIRSQEHLAGVLALDLGFSALLVATDRLNEQPFEGPLLPEQRFWCVLLSPVSALLPFREAKGLHRQFAMAIELMSG